jgi:Sulfatase-modifying factor enzyme 1
MKTQLPKHLFLQILAAVMLLTVTTCKPAEPTQVPTDTPEPTPTVIPTFELPDGTPLSWWDGSTIVYVPGGEFVMGDPKATQGDNIPAHPVRVDSFWIHRIEVTNRMYAQCVAAGVCQPPTPDPNYPNHYPKAEYADHPVASVTWQQAVDYCTWIGGRLPSEAEWEWAARGSTGEFYPWGKQDPNCSRLNFLGCTLLGTTDRVGSFPLGLSSFNVADMAGNINEWVNDRYGKDYYASSPAENPTGPASGEFRVFRSSSFRSKAGDLPVTLRFHQDPKAGQADLGFRCIVSGESVANPPPPACTTLSFVPVQRQPPEAPLHASKLPSFSLDAYCNLLADGTKYGTAMLKFDPGTDIYNLEVTSPQGTLDCLPDANHPQTLNCSGSALQPGKSVTVKACASLLQTSGTCINGLTATQEGNHIRLKWNEPPQGCCNKILVQLQCDGAAKSSVTLPGTQTEIVIDGCPQPFNSQKVCVTCLDQNNKPGEPACYEMAVQPTPTAVPIVPTCPVFYKYNSLTKMCEYRPGGLVACDPPDVVVPGYGCLPAPQSGNCPDGYYEASYKNQPVCVPASGPKCKDSVCMAPCPKGLIFNEAQLCCENPPAMAPVCPAGYDFDPAVDGCVSEYQTPPVCTVLEGMVPDCKPEQHNGGGGPTGCLIKNTSTGGLDCKIPCPVGVVNYGSCKP